MKYIAINRQVTTVHELHFEMQLVTMRLKRLSDSESRHFTSPFVPRFIFEAQYK